MAKFYFQLFACFCFALKWEGNVEASDTKRCETVMRAIKLNSTWSVRYDPNDITWRGMATASTVLKTCTCNPKNVDGLGDVSRIQYTDSTTGAVHSKNLCVNCPGVQVAVTDFNYTVGVWANGTTSTDTGPCSEVPVYRCSSCPEPTTTTPAARRVMMATMYMDPYGK